MVISLFGTEFSSEGGKQNIIQKYFTRLKNRNYIVKAEPQKDGQYWFNFYQKKLAEKYIVPYGKEFSLIIWGSTSRKLDFFAIPYSVIEYFLTPNFVYSDERTGRGRWIFSINRKHILLTRGFYLDVSSYYGNLACVFGLPEEIEYKPLQLELF